MTRKRTTAPTAPCRGSGRWWATLACAALAASISPQSAGALESDGMIIPVLNPGANCVDNNVQQCLDDAESTPVVDALMAAGVDPETFDPGCRLVFRLLVRGAQYRNAFGWYNVKPDPANPGQTLKPEVSDLHTFILPEDDAPLERTLDLSGNGAYLGGLIGFFIATGYPAATENGPPSNYSDLFFSERAHNPDGNDAAPGIHLIIWQSVTFENAFYFGWEDTLSGNDNDFQDIFTRVDGVQCSGGGQRCLTGLLGVCRNGIEQCQGGAPTCVPRATATNEQCNALDDDCDGLVDDGEALCSGNQICDRGRCVFPCHGGEFRCGFGFECNESGACVDPDCSDVTCADGQVCEAGECVDGCAGVVCPHGRDCFNGVCVDPCASIVCDEGYSCHEGICSDCDCKGCGAGQACSANVCIEDLCTSVSCAPATHCEGGNCVDDCLGASCPGGAACELGECLPPNRAGGENGANAGTGGGLVLVSPGAPSNGAGTGNGGTANDSGNANTAGRASSAPGCAACRLGQPSSHGDALTLGAAGLGLLAAALRRRARRASRGGRSGIAYN